MREGVAGKVAGAVAMLRSQIPGLAAGDAVLGALFHLDHGFRRGVTAMANRALEEAPPEAQILFVPGTVIGSPARH